MTDMPPPINEIPPVVRKALAEVVPGEPVVLRNDVGRKSRCTVVWAPRPDEIATLIAGGVVLVRLEIERSVLDGRSSIQTQVGTAPRPAAERGAA